jgi:pyruvate dehydrogenase E1 component alpha subunit
VLECITQRVRGHYEGDPQKYRDAAEMGLAAEADPVQLARDTLLKQGCTEAQMQAEAAEIQARIEAAVAAARADALPPFDSALADVYTPEQAR